MTYKHPCCGNCERFIPRTEYKDGMIGAIYPRWFECYDGIPLNAFDLCKCNDYKPASPEHMAYVKGVFAGVIERISEVTE